MKKYLLIVLLIAAANAFGQTNVSGGIFINTTWSKANSPYVVVGNIVVFPGVTLTIQPGVVVKFANGTSIEVRQSKLYAIGTKAERITFTRNVTGWDKIYINGTKQSRFDYCDFSYATRAIDYNSSNGVDSLVIANCSFRNNNSAIYTGMAYKFCAIDSCSFRDNSFGVDGSTGGAIIDYIRYSKFIHNQTGIIYYNRVNIHHCVIDSNLTLGILHESGTNDTFQYNQVKHNNIGYSTGGGGGGGMNFIHHNIIDSNAIGIRIKQAAAYQDSIYCNSISNNYLYNVEYLIPSNMNFIGNYWGTTDYSKIDSSIYDGYDSIVYGIVVYKPIDTTKCYSSQSGGGSGLQEDNYIDEAIGIYPNPSKGTFVVKCESNLEEVVVYNVLGMIVHKQEVQSSNAATVHMAGHSSGIYIISIKTASGTDCQRIVLTD